MEMKIWNLSHFEMKTFLTSLLNIIPSVSLIPIWTLHPDFLSRNELWKKTYSIYKKPTQRIFVKFLADLAYIC